MITSDTRITATSIVSHLGMRFNGCSFTARTLHTPFGLESAKAVMGYFTVCVRERVSAGLMTRLNCMMHPTYAHPVGMDNASLSRKMQRC